MLGCFFFSNAFVSVLVPHFLSVFESESDHQFKSLFFLEPSLLFLQIAALHLTSEAANRLKLGPDWPDDVLGVAQAVYTIDAQLACILCPHYGWKKLFVCAVCVPIALLIMKNASAKSVC